MRLVSELRRRNVLRMAVLYAIAAWLIMQVVEVLIELAKLPDWIGTTTLWLLAIGFPIALIFSWFYELTPKGISLEKDIDPAESITHVTGRRLDFIVISLLCAGLIVFAYDKWWLGDEITVAPPASNSIAVLPFVNMSADPDQEYFSDGISGELLNVLVQVDALHVASRTSSFAFKGTDKSLQEIADALKVNYVLEGSVRKDGNRVRIIAQLIEAASDQHLWSKSYDRDLIDIFMIQNEIANAIVAALGESLEIDVTNDIPVLAATINMSAYDSYLKAHELFIARADLAKSIALFEQAVDLDPAFARAWEGLAAAYWVMPAWGITDRDYFHLALEAAQTALELDDGLSLAYSVIGEVVRARQPYRWQDSFEYYRLAAENEPKNTTNILWRALSYMDLGYLELAMAGFDQCLSVDPHYGNCTYHKAILHLLQGDRDKGIALFLRLLESGFPALGGEFVSAFALSGDRAAALLVADRSTRRTGAPINYWVNLVENPDIDRREALEAFDQWVERENINLNAYADMALAFGAYDRITHGNVEIYNIWAPESAKFRQSPHFKRVVAEFDMLEFWRSHGFPPQCRLIGDDDFECD
jgi:TolB-like protein